MSNSIKYRSILATLLALIAFAAGCASTPPQPVPLSLQPSTEHVTGSISIELPKSLMAELQPPAARLVGTFELTGHAELISQSPPRSAYHSTLTIHVTDPDSGHTYADLQSSGDGESSRMPDELLTQSLNDLEMKLRLAGMTLQAAATTQPSTQRDAR